MSHFFVCYTLKHFDALYHKNGKSQGAMRIFHAEEKKKDGIAYNSSRHQIEGRIKKIPGSLKKTMVMRITVVNKITSLFHLLTVTAER